MNKNFKKKFKKLFFIEQKTNPEHASVDNDKYRTWQNIEKYKCKRFYQKYGFYKN